MGAFGEILKRHLGGTKHDVSTWDNTSEGESDWQEVEKISHQEYTDLVVKTIEFNKNHPYLRFGQTLFNLFYDIKPEIASAITGTDADPFHTGVDENSLSVCNFYDAVVDKSL